MTEDLRTGRNARRAGEGQQPPGPPVGTAAALRTESDEDLAREGLEVQALSQWALFRRKFVRHKAAMVSLVVLAIIFAAALFAEQIAPYDYRATDLTNADLAPTLEGQHYFGTDQIGRDYFSRTLYGTRTSLRVALIVALGSTVIGTIMGATAGYFGGWVDNLLMRFTDLVLTLPSLAVLLVASALIGQGSPYRVGVILALVLWTSLARIVRGQFLSLREKEFVEAVKAAGASDFRIAFRHILPNSLSPIIVNATLVVATAILIEATLSFLGFGVQPPTPALGSLIDDGRDSMLTKPWLVLAPGLTLVAICLAVNFVGDGLRDALDPTTRK